MIKLKRLKIEKFRNVTPGTELVFNDGFNVLLGQNGTGKTTLLSLIASALTSSFKELEGESFSLVYELSSEHGDIAVEIRNRTIEPQAARTPRARPDSALALGPRHESHEASLKLRIQFRNPDVDCTVYTDAAGSRIEVTGTVQRLKLQGLVSPLEPGFITSALVQIPPEVVSSGAITSLFFPLASLPGSIHRLDESLDTFLVITGRNPLWQPLGGPQHRSGVQLTRFKPQNFLSVSAALVPSEIPGKLWEESKDSTPDTIATSDKESPFLSHIVDHLGFRAAEARMDLIEKRVGESYETYSFGSLKFLFTRRDGSIINHDLLSYGQKRLLTFFYYLACNQDVVVADELVNGLHHTWISACVQAMGDRQVFLTSQNPLLLDHFQFDSAEQVRSTFITCHSKAEEKRERLLWSNMTKRDATSFFRAYKAGIQHVGEILQTKGFW